MKIVTKRVKKEVQKRTKQLVKRNLSSKHLMLAINARSVSEAGILYNTIICYNNTINVYIL